MPRVAHPARQMALAAKCGDNTEIWAGKNHHLFPVLQHNEFKRSWFISDAKQSTQYGSVREDIWGLIVNEHIGRVCQLGKVRCLMLI